MPFTTPVKYSEIGCACELQVYASSTLKVGATVHRIDCIGEYDINTIVECYYLR